MKSGRDRKGLDVVVIGAGQAGLTVGYHLARQGAAFEILDANERVGDSWRQRWDSLRLFSPAAYNALPGKPFPAPADYFPTKEEMADYLESYAREFELPVRTGERVKLLTRDEEWFRIETKGASYTARNVVVAMANYQDPKVPEFAGDLDADIVQLHSKHYRNPSQLKAGAVLIVGAGNSGAEIAKELSGSHQVLLAGPGTGDLPFKVDERAVRRGLVWFLLRVVFHRVLTLRTPVGRKLRPKIVSGGGPLIRTRSSDLRALGIERFPGKVEGVRSGRPLLSDGTVAQIENVIWCTGFRPDFSWIALPGFSGEIPAGGRGVVASEPGLYFVGQHFLYSLSSGMVHGVDRDVRFVTSQIARRAVSQSRISPRLGMLGG